MKHVMIDIETMGISHDAPIVQLAAVFFDIKTGRTGASLSINVDLQTSIDAGAVVDACTVLWWMRQSDSARESVLQEYVVEVSEALDDFVSFIGTCENIWCHTNFDSVILNNHFIKLKTRNTPSYRHYKDIRTLMYLSGVNADVIRPEFVGTQHTAEDDCRHQIKYCSVAYRALTRHFED